MDITKEALQYLVEDCSQIDVFEDYVSGKKYSNKPLYEIGKLPEVRPVRLQTLTSLIDFVNNPIDDEIAINHKLYVIVENPSSLRLISSLDDNQRQTYVTVEADLPNNRPLFDGVDREHFSILLKAACIQTADAEILRTFLSLVQTGTVAEYGDDGITQRATIRKGASGKDDVVVPNPVVLAPFRTFLEVAQPESEFVFRLNDDLKCRLFEADGGAWKMTAMQRIKDYLRSNITNERIIVLA